MDRSPTLENCLLDTSPNNASAIGHLSYSSVLQSGVSRSVLLAQLQASGLKCCCLDLHYMNLPLLPPRSASPGLLD